MALKIFIILTIWACGIYAEDIIAYDCADPNVEVSKISLRGVTPCIDPRKSSLEETKYIKLVQQKQYTSVHVYSCLIQVQQLIQHCGMFSHTSAVDEGFSSYIKEIGREECIKIHSANSRYLIDLRKIREGLSVYAKPNSTVHTSATIKGTLNSKGECNGEKFSYNGVDYKKVIVIADITIKLRDYQATANIEQNTVMLRHGVTCPYSNHYCFDDEAGEVAWEITDHSNKCSINNFDILYEGQATLLTVIDNNSKYIVVETNNTVFALNLVKQENICSRMVWRTEQPRLGVLFETPRYYNQKPQLVAPQNVDIMEQILTKLLYLEIAIKTQKRDLIYESINKRCILREKILRNRLALAYSSPDIVSNLVKEASGHMGRIMGEVLYVARCIPKVVNYRITKSCYQELPITYDRKEYFMAPLTRIIQEHGTQINCEKNMPAMFQLGGKWIQFNPSMQASFPEPFTLNANNPNETIPAMKIVPIDSNGIFSKQEMENFRQTLLFPNEREAISTIVARRIIGVNTESQGFRFPNIFSKTEFGSMAKSFARRIWGSFTGIVENIHTILISFLSLILVKYLSGVICNYFMLKNAATSNPALTIAASFWNMLTRLLLFRSYRKAHVNKEEKSTLSSTNNNKPLLNKSSNSSTIV